MLVLITFGKNQNCIRHLDSFQRVELRSQLGGREHCYKDVQNYAELSEVVPSSSLFLASTDQTVPPQLLEYPHLERQESFSESDWKIGDQEFGPF